MTFCLPNSPSSPSSFVLFLVYPPLAFTMPGHSALGLLGPPPAPSKHGVLLLRDSKFLFFFFYKLFFIHALSNRVTRRKFFPIFANFPQESPKLSAGSVAERVPSGAIQLPRTCPVMRCDFQTPLRGQFSETQWDKVCIWFKLCFTCRQSLPPYSVVPAQEFSQKSFLRFW